MGKHFSVVLMNLDVCHQQDFCGFISFPPQGKHTKKMDRGKKTDGTMKLRTVPPCHAVTK